MAEAVAAIKNGMSYKAATEQYGIPSSTFCDKVRDKYGQNNGQGAGRRPRLGDDFEENLAQ